MSSRILLSLSVGLACLHTGCASSCSTMLTRDENNTSWSREGHLRGIPITLKVPTHVKLYIYETYYLDTVEVGGISRTRRVPLPYPVRDFKEFIYTEKIFTVDFKRPAAGTFNMKLEMTKDQYISKVQHDVTDLTIEKVTGLIQTLAPKGIFAGAVGMDSAGIETQLATIKSVAAVGIFEIEAPDFEQQMTSFINCHLNQAHDAFVAYPKVDHFHRVEVGGYLQDSDLCNGLVNFPATAPGAPSAPRIDAGTGEPVPAPRPGTSFQHAPPAPSTEEVDAAPTPFLPQP